MYVGDDKVAVELQGLIQGEVCSSADILKKCSSDASAFRVMPRLVVFPSSVDDISLVVKYVAQQKKKDSSLSLTVRSAGTDMTGGPLNESIILDVSKHINRLRKLGKDYAIVEPGLFYRDLEKATLHKNLIYPSYPASKMLCSVGGIVSNNSGGELSLRYGQTCKWVRGLKVILHDGKEYSFSKISVAEVQRKCLQKDFEGDIYRKMFALLRKHDVLIKKSKPHTSKNSTGYLLWDIYDAEAGTFDLAQVFVGAQGTLGIVTEEKLGLISVEPHSMMYVIYLRDLDVLGEIVDLVLTTGPTSFESYDDKTLHLAIKYAGEIGRMISKEENIFKFAWHMLPDFWRIISMRQIPKLVLMVEFTGLTLAEVKAKICVVDSLMRPFVLNNGVKVYTTKTKVDAKRYWTIRRQSFNLLRKKIQGKQTVPFIDDIIVPPACLKQFLPELDAVLKEYPSLIYTIAGHMGDGNFHIIPLMDMEDAAQRRIIPTLCEKVYSLVLKYGGSLSAEHNEGLIRGPYMQKMYGKEMFGLFCEVKNIFDPDTIFNPHKKTDANLKYSLAHIKKDNVHDV